jgi:DNA-binding LacI/PurR family transcriptional regulator
MGRASAKLLLERIAGRQDAVHHQVDPVLRVRSSTWAVPAGAQAPPGQGTVTL